MRQVHWIVSRVGLEGGDDHRSNVHGHRCLPDDERTQKRGLLEEQGGYGHHDLCCARRRHVMLTSQLLYKFVVLKLLLNSK
jgi:hypothetical protein